MEHDKLAASGLRILGLADKNLPQDFDDYDPNRVYAFFSQLGDDMNYFSHN